MKYQSRKKALVLLADGTIFYGNLLVLKVLPLEKSVSIQE